MIHALLVSWFIGLFAFVLAFTFLERISKRGQRALDAYAVEHNSHVEEARVKEGWYKETNPPLSERITPTNFDSSEQENEDEETE